MDDHKDSLIYIKGFLDSISYLNTFDNNEKTYTVELIEKLNLSFKDTLRKKNLMLKNGMVKTEFIKENWREILKKD